MVEWGTWVRPPSQLPQPKQYFSPHTADPKASFKLFVYQLVLYVLLISENSIVFLGFARTRICYGIAHKPLNTAAVIGDFKKN